MCEGITGLDDITGGWGAVGDERDGLAGGWGARQCGMVWGGLLELSGVLLGERDRLAGWWGALRLVIADLAGLGDCVVHGGAGAIDMQGGAGLEASTGVVVGDVLAGWARSWCSLPASTSWAARAGWVMGRVVGGEGGLGVVDVAGHLV